MRSLLSSLANRLPSTCEVCGSWPAQPVCPACVRRFGSPRIRCLCCAAPMAIDTGRCGACVTRGTPAAVERCVAAVDYAYPWDALVARLKFRHQPGWAGPMARLMLQAPEAARLLRHCDAMVPVPLTSARLATRGYNQAWELVKALRQQAVRNRQRAAPMIGEALLRIGETPDQHSLPRAERLRNLQGTFVANPPLLPSLAGSHVLLVDDVVTTGATLQAAGQALLAVGARRVSALVFARTPAV